MITELEDPTMIGYIHDGGNALRNVLENEYAFVSPFRSVIESNDIQEIHFVGSGTSYNASLYIAKMIRRFSHIASYAAYPTRSDPKVDVACSGYRASQILYVGVSQSGTSVSTIDVLRRAREAGASTIALTDVLDSPVVEEADHAIRLFTGHEVVHVETRGYLATLFEGFLIALDLGRTRGVLAQGELLSRHESARRFAEDFDGLIAQAEDWYSTHSDELHSLRRAYVCSYDVNECTAEEAELKLTETFGKPVRGYELEEMIHGPHYALDEDTFVFFVAPSGECLKRIPVFLDWFKKNQITEHVFVITSGPHLGEFGGKSLCLGGDFPEELSPIAMILPFYIIAARNCISAGINTKDKPANRIAFAHLD
jgi:glucosamine 6-phosphate synthetase-like amidotransferase/phosphosugar isomerase protein